MRILDASTIGKVKRPASLGPVSQLQWLEIASLVVDPRYQRGIAVAGRRNIRTIAERFSWSRFAPVVVAPTEGGLYAIVDGQHRTTAALAIDIKSVPCLIIQADPTEQAQAFRAINAQTTKINTVQLYHAELAGGDEGAVAIDALCKGAGIVIPRSPTGAQFMRRGQTLAVDALRRLTKERRALALALLRGILSQSRDGTNLFRSVIIDGLRLVLIERPAWWRDEAAFIRALDSIDLSEEWNKAGARKAVQPSLSINEAMAARLITVLQPKLGAGKP